MIGSSVKSCGKSLIDWSTLSRTRCSAISISTSGLNSMLMFDTLSALYEMISFTPSIPRSLFSILKVTSDSISVGDTPEYIVVTIIYGIGISGVDSLGRFLYAREPNIIKTIIIRKTDDFHFIATFVISIGYSPRRIGEPSDKNCCPLVISSSPGAMPEMIITFVPIISPVITFLSSAVPLLFTKTTF